MKPTKKQKAIVLLLNRLDEEGLDHLVFGLDVPKLLKKIDDEDLISLVRNFDDAMQMLDAKIMQMEEAVQPFRDDEMEF